MKFMNYYSQVLPTFTFIECYMFMMRKNNCLSLQDTKKITIKSHKCTIIKCLSLECVLLWKKQNDKIIAVWYLRGPIKISLREMRVSSKDIVSHGFTSHKKNHQMNCSTFEWRKKNIIFRSSFVIFIIWFLCFLWFGWVSRAEQQLPSEKSTFLLEWMTMSFCFFRGNKTIILPFLTMLLVLGHIALGTHLPPAASSHSPPSS